MKTGNFHDYHTDVAWESRYLISLAIQLFVQKLHMTNNTETIKALHYCSITPEMNQIDTKSHRSTW